MSDHVPEMALDVDERARLEAAHKLLSAPVLRPILRDPEHLTLVEWIHSRRKKAA